MTGIQCWNPAFDVTPAEFITGGIITEHGVFAPSELKEALKPYVKDHHATENGGQVAENGDSGKS